MIADTNVVNNPGPTPPSHAARTTAIEKTAAGNRPLNPRLKRLLRQPS